VQIDEGRSAAPYIALAEFYRSIGDEPNEIRALSKAYMIDETNQALADRLREIFLTNERLSPLESGPCLRGHIGGDHCRHRRRIIQQPVDARRLGGGWVELGMRVGTGEDDGPYEHQQTAHDAAS